MFNTEKKKHLKRNLSVCFFVISSAFFTSYEKKEVASFFLITLGNVSSIKC